MSQNDAKQDPTAVPNHPAGDGAPSAAAPVARPRRRWVRRTLLALGPVLVLIVGTYVYVNTGRHVETDNAYVKADMVVVSAEVAGLIEHVAVGENEFVRAGDVLFEIDKRPYEVAVDRTEAQLEAVKAFILGLQASYQQRLEELELAHTNVAYQQRKLAREQSLAEQQLGSDADVDEARNELDVAAKQVPIIEQALAQLRAQLGGHITGGFETHPAYRAVQSMYDDALLNLHHTVVRAPINGVVSRVPLAGRYTMTGTPVMSVVSSANLWVEANYKETELTHVDVGQPVAVHIDTYPDHEWHGTVESISPATGAEFSVIPAQNASGNWVKVAQRIPVRIALEIAPGDPPLRAGMSAIVDIDTRFERPVPPMLSFLRAFKVSEPVANRN
jgi:membrane fusion protein, multidrug efflux system